MPTIAIGGVPRVPPTWFRIGDRFTDQAAGPRRGRLRQLTASEAVAAIDELLALAVETALISDQAPPDIRIATLSDLAKQPLTGGQE